MAIIFSFRKSRFENPIVGQFEGITQELLIELPVLKHVAQCRQLTAWSSEAGGQLFGTIDNEHIRVIEATGPYKGDERSRYRYRSNPMAAQRAIDERSQCGLLYLGEWHTHAEDHPSASDLDDDAMRRLILNSRLNSDSLLMLIVGRAPDITGLAVLSVSGAMVRTWQLRTLK